MLKTITLAASLVMCSAAMAQTQPQDGEIRQYHGELQAWDAEQKRWLTPEGFWKAYAQRKGGLTWGEDTEYPDYNEVKEHDTLLIELESGKCLMEFFHGRWRRANDVWRWDNAFNQYSACPRVFD